MIFVFLFASAQAQSFPDKGVLNDFYDEFVCEEKNVTSEVGVTNACSELPPVPPPGPPPPAPPQPAPPPPPAPMAGFLPIILINNSGREAFFTMFGTEVVRENCGADLCPCNPVGQTFVNFGEQPGVFTPVGSLGGAAAPTGIDPTFSKKFTYSLAINEQLTVYVPAQVQGGEIMFSIDDPIDLFVSNNNIAVPNPSDTGDPAFCQIYGQFEFTLLPTGCQDPSNPVAPLNQLSIDVTNVDYFGIPIQYSLLSLEQSVRITAGVFFSRANVFQSLRNAFDTAFLATQARWESLFLTSALAPCSTPGKTLRVLSPGESMFGRPSSPLFDINYFDNEASYGYSWAENVWKGGPGGEGFFQTNKLTIVTTKSSFVGQVNSSGEFIFSNNNKETYTIPWQKSADITEATSASIFNVSTNFPGMTYISAPGQTPVTIGPDTEEITKILSSAIIAGVIPGRTNKLTGSGPLPSLINTYYLPNGSLPNNGATFGPWFDLYSVGIIGAGLNLTGNIVYAYPYDDYLYAQSSRLKDVAPSLAKIASDTYLTITINEYSDN